MATTRTHVILPTEIVREIDTLVGKRGRSAFLAEVARREVMRRRLLKILEHPGPIWKSEDHPELKQGAAAWVSRMRRAEKRERSRRNRKP